MASVLIIDDDPMLGEVTINILEALGYTGLGAISGAQALHLLSSPAPVDLIFLDLMLPDISGLELVPKIRALRGAVPIILCSGAELDEDRFTQLGIVKFLTKPFHLTEFKNVVTEILPLGTRTE